MKSKPSKQKGYALLVVILAMFMVTMLGSAMFTMVYSDLSSRESQEKRTMLSYAAQAGVEESIFLIHKAISDGSPVPLEVQLPPFETDEFYHRAEISALILQTGETYGIDCVAVDESGKSFRILAQVRFKVNGSYQVEEFEILSYERSFSDD